jgi:hypothetical protein
MELTCQLVKHAVPLRDLSVSVAKQFAFRPTGSTTAALAYVLHHIIRMLEDSS